MSVFGEGNQTRAFSYIGDLSPIMAEAIENPMAYNQIFNIGADQPYSVNQLALAIAKAMGKETVINHLPARNEVQDAYSSHAKVEKVFGSREKHTLEQGLEKMAAWVKRNMVQEKVQNLRISKLRKTFQRHG